MSSNRKGAIAELAVAKEAAALQIPVLWPLIEHGRYDIGLEVGGQILRIQCKWARKAGEVVKVNLGTSRFTPSNGYVLTTYTADEIDAVAAYCGDLDQCFFLPIDLVAGKREIHLRLSPAKNNQQAAINYASDYEFPGAVAQLARALRWHRRGRRFESDQLHDSESSVPTAVGAEEFGYRYARFLERAAAGESFLVTRRGKPMARISPPSVPGQLEIEPANGLRTTGRPDPSARADAA